MNGTAQSTLIESKDGHEFVLYHYEDLTEAELDLFRTLTGDEFRYLLHECGFCIKPLDSLEPKC